MYLNADTNEEREQKFLEKTMAENLISPKAPVTCVFYFLGVVYSRQIGWCQSEVFHKLHPYRFRNCSISLSVKAM